MSPSANILTPPTSPPRNEQAERLLFQFVREAPYLPTARDLGVGSSPVSPWPHQLRVVRRTVDRYPQSFLLSDEVGLGKTIEAALILRQLWLSGRARRILILVPKAVLRQWQEELHEKAALEVPIFTGERFVDIRGRELEAAHPDPNPWNRRSLFLASTQLARTRKRCRELWQSQPWDLVIVDEAHHARRRQVGDDGNRRANRLLELLGGSSTQPGGLASRSRCLYLLTATPMQIHPVEVWDLLKLLGMGGRWGAKEETFIRYFEQMRLPFEKRDWSFLLPFLDEARDLEGLPPSILKVLDQGKKGEMVDAVLGTQALEVGPREKLDHLLSRTAPIQSMVWRHTRSVLREYHRRGLLSATVPERKPRNIWIPLSPAERELYDRIEEYLSRFYQRYEARRTGLGFVMTVYRRRLTSSFRAIRESLNRRLRMLQGQSSPPVPEWSEALDSEMESLDPDWIDALEDSRQINLFGGSERLAADRELPAPSRLSKDELQYLDGFIQALDELPQDSKLNRLQSDLVGLTAQRDRVLIFTQYLDTLDLLRDALRESYAVACYSGRGGEIWEEADSGESGAWIDCGKEELKRSFGAGDVQILLCTEAAGEGLNLQTCGVLINYDLPWNPMKVEQRIGRIDRIGQHYSEIWVLNYFYAETVEAVVYQRLSHRIDWFQAVLGDVQPILHRVGEALHELALTPADQRRRSLEASLAKIHDGLDHRPPDALELSSDFLSALEDLDNALHHPAPPPVLEALFVESQSLGSHFQLEQEGVYQLCLRDQSHRVTFQPQLFAEQPYSLSLLVWGNPLFDELVASVAPPELEAEPQGLGIYHTSHPAPVSLFLRPDERSMRGEMAAIRDLASLSEILSEPSRPWTRPMEGAASSAFSRARRQVLRGQEQVEAERRAADYRALRSAATEMLLRAAWIELAQARNPGLFDHPLGFSFGVEAVMAQSRHGSPFDQLLSRLGGDVPPASNTDRRYLELSKYSPEALDRLWIETNAEGDRLLDRWQSLEATDALAQRADRALGLSGILERQYCKIGEEGGQDGAQRLIAEVSAEEVMPFENAVPFFDDLNELGRLWSDGEAEEGMGLEGLASAPERCVWVVPNGRYGPGPGVFVCRVFDPALRSRIPLDSDVVLRMESRPPRLGELVLVQHPQLVSAEAGDVGIRIWSFEQDQETGLQRVILLQGDGEASTVLEDEDLLDLRVLAWVLEILR